MATITTAVPVEEYLRTSYEPDMEYVNGQLVERHVGEFFHSRLQGLIAASLLNREAEDFETFTELRIRVSDEPRYRIPDVCVKALPYEPTPVLEKPDLIIEILSPDDAASDILERVDDYVVAGIPYIWVVNPYKRKLTVVENGVLRHATSMVLETPLVGSVDFEELFLRLDRMKK